MAEAIDQMTEKSANVRITALNAMVAHLSQQYGPEVILGRRETLRDNLERILKRGAPNEQALAATVYSLSAIQIGALDPDLACEDYTAIKPCLQSLMLDHTASIPVRAKVREATQNTSQNLEYKYKSNFLFYFFIRVCLVLRSALYWRTLGRNLPSRCSEFVDHFGTFVWSNNGQERQGAGEGTK